MITNLLTEDNLPSYHREISESFSLDGVWGTWVGRWTAEENRHAIVLRDYLVVTRAVDPVLLEQARTAHMTAGVVKPEKGQQFLRSVAYVTPQELATRISHRNTGAACEEPIAERMLQRVAADENLHMIFYRNISAAALDLLPNEALRAITDVVTHVFERTDLTGEGERAREELHAYLDDLEIRARRFEEQRERAAARRAERAALAG
jgi:acyl-[acyl-carrier-protein] desaturase